MPQGFAEWKALLRYFFVVSFISLAFVIVKLKFSKVFCITSESMKGLPFSGGVGVGLDQYSHKYCSTLLKFWPEVVSNKISNKIAYFDSNGTHPKFTVLVNVGAQFTGKPKTKISSNIHRNIK